MSGFSMTGVKELQAALRKLQEDPNVKGSPLDRVTKSAIGKGLTQLKKGIQKEIPPKYKEAKKAVGSKFAKRNRRSQKEARTGIGVGIKLAKLQAMKKKDRGKRPGVGVAPQNIHWFILGTKDRTHKSGHPTGDMEAFDELKNIVRDGVTKAETAALDAIAKGMKVGLEREVKKVAKT